MHTSVSSITMANFRAKLENFDLVILFECKTVFEQPFIPTLHQEMR